MYVCPARARARKRLLAHAYTHTCTTHESVERAVREARLCATQHTHTRTPQRAQAHFLRTPPNQTGWWRVCWEHSNPPRAPPFFQHCTEGFAALPLLPLLLSTEVRGKQRGARARLHLCTPPRAWTPLFSLAPYPHTHDTLSVFFARRVKGFRSIHLNVPLRAPPDPFCLFVFTRAKRGSSST